MANQPMNAANTARLVAVDTARAARLLSETRDALLSGRSAKQPPRPVIEQSWNRARLGGVDPERALEPDLLTEEEIQRRRARSPLSQVLPVLRAGLLAVADAAHHIMFVADCESRVLWLEGSAPVLRKVDGLGLGVGADLREEAVGTNGVGTVAALRSPVQVFAGEHFVRSLTALTCAGAPISDPRTGQLLGVVDVSGPLETLHPATLSWVASVAKLAEATLREAHLSSLERLRAVAAPVLARVEGRAAVVDRDGWTAAVTGMPYTDRIGLPKSAATGRGWLPALGVCVLEPLDEGWLVRSADDGEPEAGRAPALIVLDLTRPRRWSVTVSGGAGSWSHELSPRHAELLYLLAAHPDGRSAADLAGDVFGDPGRTVTVRAELSRIRRYLGGFLEHRPYRFRDGVEVVVQLPEESRDLLPHSAAPAIVGVREA